MPYDRPLLNESITTYVSDVSHLSSEIFKKINSYRNIIFPNNRKNNFLIFQPEY